MKIIKADITTIAVDAIVNAANSSLLGGGGVDGAIHRVGGPAILEACREIVSRQGNCKTGQAVITSAGNLPAKFVIHTVGPIWNGGNNKEETKLAECYKNALQLALDNHCESIAFPNISTGVYGFPKNAAAKIAINTVAAYLLTAKKNIEVTFVCFDDENYALMNEVLKLLSL